MTEGKSPTVRRRRLGSELRHLRETTGKTIEQAAADLEISRAKLSRLELGRVPATTADVALMLDLYGVTDSTDRSELLDLARAGRQKGWWHQFGGSLSKQYQALIGLEADATSMQTYQPNVVPGLLQTEAYATAVMQATLVDEHDVTDRVAVRMARQEVLTRPDSTLSLWAVIDESVLRRPLGGPAAMRHQLEELAQSAIRPNVTVQVLPYRAGGHPALTSGPIMILEFSPDDPLVVYLEGSRSDLYIEKEADIRWFNRVFQRLNALALSPQDSIDLIHQAAKDMT